jgi:hypothetical protein
MPHGRALSVLAVVFGCADQGPVDDLVLRARDGSASISPPPTKTDDAGARADGAIGATDGAPANGIGTLETERIDLGKRVIGSESHGSIVVRGDPNSATRVRVVRIDGGSELTLEGLRIGEALTIDPSTTMSIGVVLRVATLGEKQFRVGLELCEAGCSAEATIVAEAPEPVLAGGGNWFIDTPIGTCVPWPVVFESRVDDVLEVIRATTGGDFRVEGTTPSILPARGRLTIDTVYCPQDLGRDQTWVEVEVAARPGYSNTTLQLVLLIGDPVPAGCTLVFEPTIDFGAVSVGSEAASWKTVANEGFETCQLEFLGTARTSSAFRLDRPVAGTIKPLRLHETMDVHATFAPTAPGSFGDRIVIRTNDVNRPTASIGLVGVGYDAPGFLVEIERDVPLVAGRGMPLPFEPTSNDGAARIRILSQPMLFGREMHEVYVSTNGFIAFDPNGAERPNSQPIPSASAPSEMIAWWWDDLDPGAPLASATWSIVGPTGNPYRSLHFTFLDVPLSGGSPSSTVNAQIRITENGVIEVHYGELSDPIGAVFQASAGWNGAGGAHGADVLGCSPLCQSAQWPTNTIVRYIPYQ